MPNTRLRVQAHARRLVGEECESVAPDLDTVGTVWLGRGTLVPAWFDPSGDATVRVPPNAPPETADILREFSPEVRLRQVGGCA